MGDLDLRNRIVMAPLTRMRADDPAHAPTELHALYYAQRASAGLIPSLKLDANAANVHSNLGVILRKKGDTAGAMRELEAAVKLAPTDAGYQNNYGVALRTANKLPEAAAHSRRR